MNNKPKKVASGIAFVEVIFEAIGGIISGLVGVFFSLIGWLIGLGIIVVLVAVIWGFAKNTDFSGISENLQSGIDNITEGGSIEGWVSEVDLRIKVPTEEEITEARRLHEEREQQRKQSGSTISFEFRVPKERQVTIVTFRDKRFKEFTGVSPKPIPLQKYVVIRYNSWTNSISDIEVVEKPDPLLEKIE